MKIAIIGSGFAGICAGIQLLKNGYHDFVIFEKEDQVGGTWYLNTYPGCACDIPSVLYSFSFEPWAGWSRHYSGNEEIHRYIRHCVEKYGLKDHLKLKTDIVSMAFQDQGNRWRIKTGSGTEEEFDLVIGGTGGLNLPAFPEIEGLESFKGSVFHSAQWDHDFDLSDTNIGVIGTGASAIQFVPEVISRVGKLHLFQRTPPWVMPKFNPHIPGFIRSLFSKLPIIQKALYWCQYLMNEIAVVGFIKWPSLMKLVQMPASWYLKLKVSDPDLRRKLTPDYLIGCKRILLSENYYDAFSSPAMNLHTEGIKSVSEEGILSVDGTRIKLDAIVLATGFRATEYLSNIDVSGSNGLKLSTYWERERGEAFMGTLIHDFPNFFTLTGPNTGLGHNSMIHIMESQMKLIIRLLAEMKTKGADKVLVKKEVQSAYSKDIRKRMKSSIWQTGGCQSWYQDDRGENTTLLPRSTWWFRRRAKKVPMSYFEFLQS